MSTKATMKMPRDEKTPAEKGKATEIHTAVKRPRTLPLQADDMLVSDKQCLLRKLQQHPVLQDALKTHGMLWDEVEGHFSSFCSPTLLQSLLTSKPGLIDAIVLGLALKKHPPLCCLPDCMCDRCDEENKESQAAAEEE